MAVGAPAAAAEPQWGFVRSSDDVRLFYGYPESDVLSLNIICAPARRRIDLIDFALPEKSRPGRQVEVTLRNGMSTLAYAGKIANDPTHGASYVEAQARFDAALFRFLGAGTRLVVDVPGKSQTIPLNGISKPLAAMEKACLGTP